VGLKVGEGLLSVDGEKLSADSNGLRNIIQEKFPGPLVTLTFRRK
jgi:hypothetical protein